MSSVRPSASRRLPKSATREMKPKYTANPSPFSRHSSRPKIAIPVHVAAL